MTFPALDRIEALARNLDGWQRQLADRMAELEQTSAEGVSDSGLVRVTAAADGKIVSTELNARAMRLDSYSLAEEFTAAANRAQEAAAARVRELVGEVIGDPGAGRAGPPTTRNADDGRRESGTVRRGDHPTADGRRAGARGGPGASGRRADPGAALAAVGPTRQPGGPGFLGVLLNVLSPNITFGRADNAVDWLFFGVGGRGAPDSQASVLHHALTMAAKGPGLRHLVLGVTDQRLLLGATAPVGLLSSSAADERAQADIELLGVRPANHSRRPVRQVPVELEAAAARLRRRLVAVVPRAAGRLRPPAAGGRGRPVSRLTRRRAGGQRRGVHHREPGHGSGQHHVQPVQSAGLGGDDLGRFDDDDVVVLQALDQVAGTTVTRAAESMSSAVAASRPAAAERRAHPGRPRRRPR